MMIRISKNLFIVLLLDIMLLCASFYLAHLIRFDFIKEQWVDISFLRLLPYVLGCKILFFYLFDLYRGMWRYTSLSDLINIIKASVFFNVYHYCSCSIFDPGLNIFPGRYLL